MRENSFIRGLNDIAAMAGKEAEALTGILGEAFGAMLPTGHNAPTGAAPNPQQPQQGQMQQPQQGVEVASADEGDAFQQQLNSSLGLSQGKPLFQPAKVVFANQGATRNQGLQPDLQENIGMAVGAVYGPGYEARVYSGGQPSRNDPKTGKGRVGTVRHDGGRAADIHVYDPEGNRVTGSGLAPLAQFWKASQIGGVGLEMRGGGIHLDNWTTPPEGGGMSWAYGDLTPEQSSALASGAAREMPQLAQEWSADLIARSGNPDRAVTLNNVYASLSEGLTDSQPRISTSGTSTEGTSDPVVMRPGSDNGRTARANFEIEAALGGMLDDMYGNDNYDEQMKKAGQSSVLEVLSVGLGQMSRGDRVDVTGVLRAQEARNKEITTNRMQRMRSQMGAELVLEQGGSMQMAQALASGAISYSDILNERQISNAEAEIARRNAKDDKVAAAMQTALTDLGYSPEMVQAGMADPGTFFKLADLQVANEAVELERLKTEQAFNFRRSTAQEMSNSSDPIERRAAVIMGQSQFTMDPADAMEAAQNQEKRTQDIDKANRETQDAQRADTEREAALVQAETFKREIATKSESGEELTDLDAEIFRQIELAGKPITVPEAQEAALKVLAARKEAAEPLFRQQISDLMLIENPETGKNFTRDEATAQILLKENAGSADSQAYEAGLARATAAGPEALAAFNEKYPDGLASYALVRAGREGGLEDRVTVIPTAAAEALPPINSTNQGSLMDNVTRLSGVIGAATDLANVTIGQFTGDVDEAYTKTKTAFNSWRNDAIQALRSEDRMLAQELALIINDVAPSANAFTPPDVLKNRIETVDAQLRGKLAAEQRTYEALTGVPNVTDTALTASAKKILAIENVLENLHRPREELAEFSDEEVGGTITREDGTEVEIDYNPVEYATEEDMDAAFESIPSGVYFVDPFGNTRVKP